VRGIGYHGLLWHRWWRLFSMAVELRHFYLIIVFSFDQFIVLRRLLFVRDFIVRLLGLWAAEENRIYQRLRRLLLFWTFVLLYQRMVFQLCKIIFDFILVSVCKNIISRNFENFSFNIHIKHSRQRLWLTLRCLFRILSTKDIPLSKLSLNRLTREDLIDWRKNIR